MVEIIQEAKEILERHEENLAANVNENVEVNKLFFALSFHFSIIFFNIFKYVHFRIMRKERWLKRQKTQVVFSLINCLIYNSHFDFFHRHYSSSRKRY